MDFFLFVEFCEGDEGRQTAETDGIVLTDDKNETGLISSCLASILSKREDDLKVTRGE